MKRDDCADKICTAFVMCAAVLGYITLTVSLGIYSFDNPDSEAIYAVVDDSESMFTKD